MRKKYKLVMSAHDIMQILGVSKRSAQRMRREIKEAYSKGFRQQVTVSEFSEYNAIPENEIQEFFWRIDGYEPM